jgi:hypothetical protein
MRIEQVMFRSGTVRCAADLYLPDNIQKTGVRFQPDVARDALEAVKSALRTKNQPVRGGCHN